MAAAAGVLTSRHHSLPLIGPAEMAALRGKGSNGAIAFRRAADSWVSSDSRARVGDPIAACCTLNAKWLRVTLGDFGRGIAVCKWTIEGEKRCK